MILPKQGPGSCGKVICWHDYHKIDIDGGGGGGGGGGEGGGGDKCTTDGKFMPYMSCMPVGTRSFCADLTIKINCYKRQWKQEPYN